MSVARPTAHVRHYYERTASRYDEYVGYFERWFVDDGRQWATGQARGDVLEIGVGTGRNLPLYAASTRVTGIDLSPAMLALARQRSAAHGRADVLHLGDAQAMDFPNDAFDTVVATLVLSSVPDLNLAIQEIRRVLRPGGQVVIVDHFRSPHWWAPVIQRCLNPWFVRWYGESLVRDPVPALVAAGFVLEQETRAKAGTISRIVARLPPARPA